MRCLSRLVLKFDLQLRVRLLLEYFIYFVYFAFSYVSVLRKKIARKNRGFSSMVNDNFKVIASMQIITIIQLRNTFDFLAFDE